MLITWRGFDYSAANRWQHKAQVVKSLWIGVRGLWRHRLVMMASIVNATDLKMQRVPFKKMKKEKVTISILNMAPP